MMMKQTLRSTLFACKIIVTTLIVAQFTPAQGTYNGPAALATANSPATARSGDIDGDGDLDFVVASNLNNTIEVYKNDGTGSFSLFSTTSVAPGIGPVNMTLVRIDGDPDLDAAVVCGFNNTVSILVNDGNGTFSLATNLPVGQSPLSITAGDIDLDGDQDLVTANFLSNNVTLLLNLGGGSFGVGSSPFIGARPTSCMFMDLENDGDQDFVLVLSGFNAVVTFQNIGTTFVFDGFYAVGAVPVDITAADVDFNGRRDLIVANAASNNVSVLRASGIRAFMPAVNYAVPTRPIRVSATQSDYQFGADIAVASYDAFKLSVLRNNGSGAFVLNTSTLVGAAPTTVMSGDFDGDSFDDLATTNFRSHNVAVLYNQSLAVPYPGTNEDLILATGINGPVTNGPGEYVKFAKPSDVVTIFIDSPGGALDFHISFVGAQLYYPGFPPPPSLPNFYLNAFGFGAVSVLDVPVLPPSGVMTFGFVPPGLGGLSVMLQGAAFDSAASNGVLSITDAHELRLSN